MPAMRRQVPEPVRLFVAVYPPLGLAREMAARAAAMDLPRHRATPTEQVHLTLQFIGEREPSEVAEVLESVRRSAAGLPAFTLETIRLMNLPQRGAARLVAAEFSSPAALLEIQRRLAHRLARNPRERSGDRFVPHMTLLRFGSVAPGVRVDSALALPAFEVREVLVMKSWLRPDRAVHAEVARVALEPA